MTRDVLSAFVPNEMRMIILKVVSYKDKNFEGFLESPFLGGSRWFGNLTQLLFLIEEVADELNCPRRTSERRSFQKSADAGRLPLSSQPPPGDAKPLASFKVFIMFRQNASWQGRCEWMEQQQSASFRSALELVQLMDGVLSQ